MVGYPDRRQVDENIRYRDARLKAIDVLELRATGELL